MTFLLFGGALQAEERWPSSDLLLPCFDVRLDGGPGDPLSLSTYFAVVNSGTASITVRISVLSNWGIEVFSTMLALDPNEVGSFDLGRWLVDGTLPDRQLTAAEILHVQAALCGEASPLDGQYYSTPEDLADPLRAVGSVRIEVLPDVTGAIPDVLWGDFFVAGPAAQWTEGEVLANLDPILTPGAEDADDLCNVHAFRFLDSPAFGLETAFMVWNPLE